MSTSMTAPRKAQPAARPAARKPLLAAGLLVLAGLAGGPLHAASEPPLYQVEVVVFAQPAGTSVEGPPRQPEPRETEAPPEVPSAEPEVGADEIVGLEDELEEPFPPGFASASMPLTLERVAAAMNRGGYRLLWHQAWVQPALTGKALSVDELAALGEAAAPGGLQGQVGLIAGRFLHVGLDLEWLSDTGLEAELRQRRRVRLGEEHYFDDPAIGVIAVVTRLEPETDQSSAQP